MCLMSHVLVPLVLMLHSISVSVALLVCWSGLLSLLANAVAVGVARLFVLRWLAGAAPPPVLRRSAFCENFRSANFLRRIEKKSHFCSGFLPFCAKTGRVLRPGLLNATVR